MTLSPYCLRLKPKYIGKVLGLEPRYISKVLGLNLGSASAFISNLPSLLDNILGVE